jgi:hypothetical protein
LIQELHEKYSDALTSSVKLLGGPRLMMIIIITTTTTIIIIIIIIIFNEPGKTNE